MSPSPPMAIAIAIWQRTCTTRRPFLKFAAKEMGALKMEDRKKQDRHLHDQYFGKCRTGKCKTGKWRTILQGWKMQDQKMQDWISKDHFAGAMALSAVKLCIAQFNTASLTRLYRWPGYTYETTAFRYLIGISFYRWQTFLTSDSMPTVKCSSRLLII